MGKIAIIHFSPIELYPPVTNLLNFLASEQMDIDVTVFTSHTTFASLQEFKSLSDNIHIVRLGKSGQKTSVLTRYWTYLIFYLGCLGQLIYLRPHTILYYETLSSLPALLYKRFINRAARVMVHYHEYTSPQEYRNSMQLVNVFHQMEERMYASFTWLSHTNEVRLQKFIADHSSVKFTCTEVLPNYPPQAWLSKARNWNNNEPLRIVYVGSLGLETTFISEFCAWVKKQFGNIQFDIYGFNINEDVRMYLNNLKSDNINFFPGFDYSKLPAILSNYHVGVILYTGHIQNYIHNAPNKLFEYLACGLDVWFSKELLGSYPYITNKVYPKVVKVDFNSLDEFDWTNALVRKGANEKMSEFYYEKVIGKLANSIQNEL